MLFPCNLVTNLKWKQFFPLKQKAEETLKVKNFWVMMEDTFWKSWGKLVFIELPLQLNMFHSRGCFVLLYALGRITKATPPEPPPPAEGGISPSLFTAELGFSGTP